MSVIIVIDDEQRQRNILETILTDEGYEVYAAPSAEKGLELIKLYNPDVVLTDLKMGGMTGLQLLGVIPEGSVKPSVIIMTAYGTISSAVEAMKKGAFDYLTKPLEKDAIVMTVQKAAERMQLIRENISLRNALYNKFSMDGIIGNSAGIQEIMEVVRKVAPTAVTVLIYGESGTGKELIARAVHYNSPRKGGPFTAINCAAIPDTLIESELFGYEPGAFTGASHRKNGLFEASNKGTLFLDEIGDLPMLTQTKLLRVLQDKEIRRIGGHESIKVDVRIIAATNKDLEKEVSTGKFREDLFYRLKVVSVKLPPLKDRREDIPLLVDHFIKKYNLEFGRRVKGVSEGTMRALKEYYWPGNIRQLESVIERAVLMCDCEWISVDDIKGELKLPGDVGIFDLEIPDEGINFEEVEKMLIKKAMTKSGNVAAKAARLLGMSYKTFWYRLEKFGLNDNSSNGEGSAEVK
ncbi:MAG TPA: sigma-54 dependent transcriptional regulator [Dissulfurispiraceae bacterium]|nr:sigma-54 dependent transcriptional regulator [Dissulfurispiraceae bacterium]